MSRDMLRSVDRGTCRPALFKRAACAAAVGRVERSPDSPSDERAFMPLQGKTEDGRTAQTSEAGLCGNIRARVQRKPEAARATQPVLSRRRPEGAVHQRHALPEGRVGSVPDVQRCVPRTDLHLLPAVRLGHAADHRPHARILGAARTRHRGTEFRASERAVPYARGSGQTTLRSRGASACATAKLSA